MEALAGLADLPVVKRSFPPAPPPGRGGVVPIPLRPATAVVWRSDPFAAAADVPAWKHRVRQVDYAPVDYLAAWWLLAAHGLLGTPDPLPSGEEDGT